MAQALTIQIKIHVSREFFEKEVVGVNPDWCGEGSFGGLYKLKDDSLIAICYDPSEDVINVWQPNPNEIDPDTEFEKFNSTVMDEIADEAQTYVLTQLMYPR